MLLLVGAAGMAQVSPGAAGGGSVRGRVLGEDGRPVSGAVVHLESKGTAAERSTRTDGVGGFVFSTLAAGSYKVRAELTGARSDAAEVRASEESGGGAVDLVLRGGGAAGAASQAMEFADKPNFSVAGVTDWTAVGGHGSDSTLRTSESLASETRGLKPVAAVDAGGGATAKETESWLRSAVASAPGSFAANRGLGEFYLRTGEYAQAVPALESAYRIEPGNQANQYDLALASQKRGDVAGAQARVKEFLAQGQSADLHRLAGELDETAGDPLAAVHEFEQAVKLDPSEQNYFAWGSELLVHRAVWQAQEVFQRGAERYPRSARMQTGLGSALFAGARYEDAAQRFCAASDLSPSDAATYVALGKIEMAAPDALGCVGPKLAAFQRKEPGSSVANYLYAMSILKQRAQVPDGAAVQRAEGLLEKAVAEDAKCSEGYLQLGILAASRRDFPRAIGFYERAIAADSQLADAHYRLGVAYDRTGRSVEAKQEFALHDRIKQEQTEATERQRREVKQFLVVAQPGVK